MSNLDWISSDTQSSDIRIKNLNLVRAVFKFPMKIPGFVSVLPFERGRQVTECRSARLDSRNSQRRSSSLENRLNTEIREEFKRETVEDFSQTPIHFDPGRRVYGVTPRVFESTSKRRRQENGRSEKSDTSGR